MATHLAVFRGYDAAHDANLWVSNGTAAGTSEVGGFSATGINGVYAGGLDPTYMTTVPFDGEVLFDGFDLAGHQGLWVTNGSTAGTYELTGISGANSNGIFWSAVTPSFTAIKFDEMLFEGTDTAGNQGLWVTNGTAADTYELTGIDGAYSGGLQPSFMTAFDGEVLFDGLDTAGNAGLWVTNGTAAGTYELAGISGAFNAADTPFSGGLGPSYMTVFDGTIVGGEVLFDGGDTAGNSGLWVTNGTVAGTYELAGISGANTNGIFGGGLMPNMAVLNGEVLFQGRDASPGDGDIGLWATDGTAGGTHEITGISGADTFGIDPIEMIVLHGEVLFNGTDTSGNPGLWVTNGTAGGTFELGGFGNSGISGASTTIGLNPGAFQMFNGEVLFQGTDSDGVQGLWVTDGFASGTSELTGISGAFGSGLSPEYIAALDRLTTVDDFYGNGTSDVLFRNDAGGDTGFFAINNGANAGWHDVGASSTAYTVAGVGDFTGSGTDDILYRSNVSGDTGFYEISNGAISGWHDIGASSTAYNVVGVGDFTGSGTEDVLYRNNASGDTGFYEMVNGVNTGWHDIGASSTAYSVLGVGDFTGSGTEDVLYRNNTSGDTGFYQMVNGVNAGWHDIGASSTAYSVVGVGDFFGNGTDDILYRNNLTGDTGFYAISNGANVGWHDIGASSTAYTVVATGDYLGTGTADVMFRNNTTGDTGFYEMVNGVNMGWHDIGASSTAYHVTS
jgi:ELWxxDGT repeat protein